MAMVNVLSWGRLQSGLHDIRELSHSQAIESQLCGSSGIAYGMGRSYGDACLNPNGVLWKTTSLDRFISFDETTGRLRCEAGVLLLDIQRLFIPRGWILPVSPGTQWVTVGGAIANDVHGKNHHVAGSFGNHIHWLELARTDGSLIECGPTRLPEWFSSTIGGIGLTGVITKAEIQLQRVDGAWLDTETIPFNNLREFFQLSNDSESAWNYAVSWIDCLSKHTCRGIFMRANSTHLTRKEPASRSFKMLMQPPVSLITPLTLKPFNAVYFNMKKRQAGRSIMHYKTFFYPLDNIQHWNKIYGPKGFFQYQSVVSHAQGYEVTQAMLHEIARSGEGSFLAVLKTFGEYQPLGMLSFPKKGVTLALDFPNRGDSTKQLFKRLDAIIKEAGGRIYLAKDARMPRDLFEAGYPRLNEFLQYRDPGISSAMSRRLMGS